MHFIKYQLQTEFLSALSCIQAAQLVLPAATGTISLWLDVSIGGNFFLWKLRTRCTSGMHQFYSIFFWNTLGFCPPSIRPHGKASIKLQWGQLLKDCWSLVFELKFILAYSAKKIPMTKVLWLKHFVKVWMDLSGLVI